MCCFHINQWFTFCEEDSIALCKQEYIEKWKLVEVSDSPYQY